MESFRSFATIVGPRTLVVERECTPWIVAEFEFRERPTIEPLSSMRRRFSPIRAIEPCDWLDQWSLGKLRRWTARLATESLPTNPLGGPADAYPALEPRFVSAVRLKLGPTDEMLIEWNPMSPTLWSETQKESTKQISQWIALLAPKQRRDCSGLRTRETLGKACLVVGVR